MLVHGGMEGPQLNSVIINDYQINVQTSLSVKTCDYLASNKILMFIHMVLTDLTDRM